MFKLKINLDRQGPRLLPNICLLPGPHCFSFPSTFNLSPIQNLKEALDMPPEMYCIICLSEIMRLSDFRSPLFYPSS
jgi:hypothetical protein